MIQARSLEEATEWARRWPVLDGGGNVQLEIRQVYELEEFGDSDAVKRMREQVFDELPPKGWPVWHPRRLRGDAKRA